MIENGSWIVVHRSKALGWQDIFRAYKVKVDGVVRGTVRRGGSLTCEVFPGTHVVQATIDWGGSPEVTVAGGKIDRHSIVVGELGFTRPIRFTVRAADNRGATSAIARLHRNDKQLAGVTGPVASGPTAC